jgi:hypothetical protein
MALSQDPYFGLNEFSELGSLLHERLGNGLDGDSCVGSLIEGLVYDSPGSFSEFFDKGKRFHLLPEYILMLYLTTHICITYKLYDVVIDPNSLQVV